MQTDDTSTESFRSAIDANYEWPALFTFKFIVPREQIAQVLAIFEGEPAKVKESSSGRFTSYTFEMEMNSSLQVVETYQSVAHIPGLISL
ncbi:MAG: putative lipoic acid-binding regulatory protein [Lentimonas sp.]|jgi:putative lipoic acid-binding regulatory protein